MDHETVERVARAIYDNIDDDQWSASMGSFGDGKFVNIVGHIDFIQLTYAAIEAYREANNETEKGL